jgi:hypothetical protein
MLAVSISLVMGRTRNTKRDSLVALSLLMNGGEQHQCAPMLGRHLPCRGMLFITKLDRGREENPRGQDRITSISTSKRTTDGNKCRRSFSPKCLMLFYDCYEKSSLSLSRSLSLWFSHLHRRLIRLAISAGVTLTVCCSFPSRCRRRFNSARSREGSIYNRQ